MLASEVIARCDIGDGSDTTKGIGCGWDVQQPRPCNVARNFTPSSITTTVVDMDRQDMVWTRVKTQPPAIDAASLGLDAISQPRSYVL